MRELSPGAEIAGYRIEAVIARGGMGVVYRAIQRRPERIVALKVIAPELAHDDQFRARFEREANLAAQIEHPHVIPVHEVGDDNGLFYLVMRYVDGSDLRTLIARERRLSPMRASRIVSQVAAALDAAHRRGLVHRDVKPGNVMISDDGSEEHAYLTDFGLVKLIAAETTGMTATGAFVGTLDYIAPEQLEGRADARSDVYALGGVLYNALTGAPPYPGASAAAKMWAHVNAPSPVVSAAAPELPAEFDDVVERAMAKRPEDRYPSAGDLGRAALAVAGGLSSYPEPAVEQSVATGEAAPIAPAERADTPAEEAPVAVPGVAAHTGSGGAPSPSEQTTLWVAPASVVAKIPKIAERALEPLLIQSSEVVVWHSPPGAQRVLEIVAGHRAFGRVHYRRNGAGAVAEIADRRVRLEWSGKKAARMADADSGAELATYSWRLLRGEVILMGSGREFRRSFIPDFRRQTWEIADDAHATPRTEQVTHWLIADRRGRLVVQFVQPTARAGPSVRTMLKARLHTSTDDADLPLLLVFGGFLLL